MAVQGGRITVHMFTRAAQGLLNNPKWFIRRPGGVQANAHPSLQTAPTA